MRRVILVAAIAALSFPETAYSAIDLDVETLRKKFMSLGAEKQSQVSYTTAILTVINSAKTKPMDTHNKDPP